MFVTSSTGITSVVIGDDPRLDGTDLAHPAYWRGQDSGVFGVCRVLNKDLDEGEVTGTCEPVLQRLRERIAGLRKELD